MKILVSLFILSVCSSSALAQLTPTVNPVIDQFGTIKSRNTENGKTNKIQSVYLYDAWINADIYIQQPGGTPVKVEGIPTKLDLITSTLELETSRGIKVLPLSKVDRFEWINPVSQTREVFTNGSKFSFNGTKVESLCGIFGDDVKMVTYHYVEILPADYNVALDVGSKEEKVIKKSKFYLLRGNELVEFTRKSVIALMDEKGDQIKQFIKKNRVNFAHEGDLRSLVKYCDSLVQ